jgi:hypothetical protein
MRIGKIEIVHAVKKQVDMGTIVGFVSASEPGLTPRVRVQWDNGMVFDYNESTLEKLVEPEQKIYPDHPQQQLFGLSVDQIEEIAQNMYADREVRRENPAWMLIWAYWTGSPEFRLAIHAGVVEVCRIYGYNTKYLPGKGA